MEVVTTDLVKGKTVLLRLDIDVPVENGRVLEDFRLKASLNTLRLCLNSAQKVIVLGHLGRPNGQVVPELSVAPIHDWYDKEGGLGDYLNNQRLRFLENLRFEKGEDDSDIDYAKQLASFGDFFVNESFASHHKSASTTVLPTLMPHAAGLRFAREVDKLTEVSKNPTRPLVAIIGGAKVEDKYPAVVELGKLCDKVLVGGLLAKRIKDQGLEIPTNVVLGTPNEEGIDLSAASLGVFTQIIENSKGIIWSGPVGKYEDPNGNQGNQLLAHAILNSGLTGILGGGDTIASLDKLNLLTQFTDQDSPVFVSVGGGAMLKFLTEGTIPALQALA